MNSTYNAINLARSVRRPHTAVPLQFTGCAGLTPGHSSIKIFGRELPDHQYGLVPIVIVRVRSVDLFGPLEVKFAARAVIPMTERTEGVGHILSGVDTGRVREGMLDKIVHTALAEELAESPVLQEVLILKAVHQPIQIDHGPPAEEPHEAGVLHG